MQDEQKLIIPVKDMRRLTKGSLDNKTDAEVELLISQLDFLAKLYLDSVVARKETADKRNK